MRRLTLTQQEQSRLQTLNLVLEGRMGVLEAAGVLGLSVRQAWRIMAAYRREGVAALAHGNRGWRPANAISEETRQRVIELAGTRYAGVNHTHPVYSSNTLLISNGFASMGFALPAAITAKLLYPQKKVVAVCGDGGFLMNVQELETACRMRLNIVIVIFRDDGYNLIKSKSMAKFGKAFGVDFTNPDFAKLANSFGIEGVRVQSADSLEGILTWAFSRDKPVVVDVPIDYSSNELLTKLL